MRDYKPSVDMIREFKKEYAKLKSKEKEKIEENDENEEVILEATKLFKFFNGSSFKKVDKMFAEGKSSADILQELRTRLNKDRRFYAGFTLSPEYQVLKEKYKTRFNSLIENQTNHKAEPAYALKHSSTKSGVSEEKLESFLFDNLKLIYKVCIYAWVVKKALEASAGDVDSETKRKTLATVDRLINSGVLTSDGSAIDLNRDSDAVELLIKRLRALAPEPEDESSSDETSERRKSPFCLKLCSSRYSMTSLMIVDKAYIKKWDSNKYVKFKYDEMKKRKSYKEALGWYYVVLESFVIEFPEEQTGISDAKEYYEELCDENENDLKDHQLIKQINKDGLEVFGDLFETAEKQDSGSAPENDDVEEKSGLSSAFPNSGFPNIF